MKINQEELNKFKEKLKNKQDIMFSFYFGNLTKKENDFKITGKKNIQGTQSDNHLSITIN